MGKYDTWVDGYLLETDYGTSLIANTNTQTYSLGILHDDAIHPSPKSSVIYAGTGVNSQEVPVGSLWKGPEDLRGSYNLILQNGILFYLVMGGSTTAASIHTIIPNPASPLPSITIQHDLTDSAAVSTDWGTQYKGVKVTKLELNCSFETQQLWAGVDWVAQTSSKQAFVSTNAPVLPTTATASSYLFGSMTATFDSVSFRDGLIDLQLTISPELLIWRDSTRTIPEPIDGGRKKYQLVFHHTPADSTFWEEAAATGNTKDIVLKWTKSTNDYIQITLSDVQVLYHEQKSPTIGQALVEEVICEARAVSIAVKDTITAGFYGE